MFFLLTLDLNRFEKKLMQAFFPAVGAGAGGVWEGEWRAAGIRQLCSAADRRLLPRHLGAGRQCPGGVMLTTLTSVTTRLNPGTHLTCSWTQAPPTSTLRGSWKEARKLGHYLTPPELFSLVSPRPPWNKLSWPLSAFLSHVSLMPGLRNRIGDVHKVKQVSVYRLQTEVHSCMICLMVVSPGKRRS